MFSKIILASEKDNILDSPPKWPGLSFKSKKINYILSSKLQQDKNE